jgi:choline dehydrogenase-like flavoprotein
MLKYGLPGDGNHAGASFPMTETPTENQTDVYGRLPEFSRVHMVDSSVLSTIPAPTISYTVMANAHRIGWESVELDNELI